MASSPMDKLRALTWDVSASQCGLQAKTVIDNLLVRSVESGVLACIQSFIDREKTLLDALPEQTLVSVRAMSDHFQGLPDFLKKTMNIQPCSRGWLKMYEMLSVHSLLQFNHQRTAKDKKVYALFNCELPGAFLAAAIHYASSQGMTMEWMASSLHPSAGKTAIKDIFKMVAKFPDRWLMRDKEGENGDMTNLYSVKYLIKKVKEKLKAINLKPALVDLYVSDGGMDIGTHYDKQEVMHQGLVMGEFIVCISTLAYGGNGVIKLYTFCSDFMRSLIAIALLCFKSVLLTKPVTSRAGNTEVYMVMKNFLGRPKNVLSYLEKAFQDVTAAFFARRTANPLIKMDAPEMALFTSICITALDAISRNMSSHLHAIVERCHDFTNRNSWKGVKLGTVTSDMWLDAMMLKR